MPLLWLTFSHKNASLSLYSLVTKQFLWINIFDIGGNYLYIKTKNKSCEMYPQTSQFSEQIFCDSKILIYKQLIRHAITYGIQLREP